MTWLAVTILGLLVCFTAEMGWPGVALWGAMLPFVLLVFAPLIEKEIEP